MSRCVVAWTFLVAWNPMFSAQESLREVTDPVAALRAQVERITGKKPADCGQVRRLPPDSGPVRTDMERLLRRSNPEPDGVRPDRERLERVVACGRSAAAERRAFWGYIGGYGFDSWVASGVLGSKHGTIFTFEFDSSPCGSPGSCPGRFTATMCASPVVQSTGGSVYVGCGDKGNGKRAPERRAP
jgi:hypothetical protein